MMLQHGDIVTVKVHPGPWVCMDRIPDPHGRRRWRLVQEQPGRFRVGFDQVETGVTLLRRPTFAPGLQILHFGRLIEVIEDRGSYVRCSTPARRRLIDQRTGAHLAIPGGVADYSKGALVAENLNLLLTEQTDGDS